MSWSSREVGDVEVEKGRHLLLSARVKMDWIGSGTRTLVSGKDKYRFFCSVAKW